jgi:hypothetical protein
MLGVMAGASALRRAFLATVVLGLTLGACDLPGLGRERPPTSLPPVEATEAPDEDQQPGGERSPVEGKRRVAAYMGWRNATGVDEFASWLGRPVWAHDFLDHRQGWTAVAEPQAQLDTWERWSAEDEDRRLVLSVPLLIESAAGDFSGGATGSYDRHFRRLARSLVAHGLTDTIIRLGWEFNGSTFPWAVRRDQIGDYKRFWRRAVATMRNVDGADFVFDWCPNITLDATGLPFAELYPGDDTVDVIGLGFYDYYWGHPSASPEARWRWLRNVENGLADHRDFARAHDKPISYPEYGLWAPGTSVGGGGDNPYFVEQFAEWVAGNNVAYHGYNNVNATADHRLSSYPRARQAFLEAFGR